jgi:hypothetical protein
MRQLQGQQAQTRFKPLSFNAKPIELDVALARIDLSQQLTGVHNIADLDMHSLQLAADLGFESHGVLRHQDAGGSNSQPIAQLRFLGEHGA